MGYWIYLRLTLKWTESNFPFPKSNLRLPRWQTLWLVLVLSCTSVLIRWLRPKLVPRPPPPRWSWPPPPPPLTVAAAFDFLFLNCPHVPWPRSVKLKDGWEIQGRRSSPHALWARACVTDSYTPKTYYRWILLENWQTYSVLSLKGSGANNFAKLPCIPAWHSKRI